jgi:protein SCO1/2
MNLRLGSVILVAVWCAVVGASCRQDTGTRRIASSTNPHVYAVKGVIREVLQDRKQIRIEHEEIPGYMPKMTMLFDVKDASELTGLQSNDVVAFKMIVTDDDGWIEQIKKSGSAAPPPVASSSLRRTRDVEPLAVGDRMPDYRFTNELGRVVHLSDFKSQAYALTFIFTRCPFPTFCPQLSKSFQQTQAALQSIPNAPTNWHLLSITIDPDFDTPAVLREYARRHQAEPGHWSFLTAALIDIDAIGEQFGLQFWRPSPDALPNHNVRTVVVDAAGRVQWITPENTWKPEDLSAQLLKATAAR